MDTRQAAKAEEHRMAKDARNAGVPAFEFPANATPEQKAAMAKRVCCHSPFLFLLLLRRLVLPLYTIAGSGGE